MAGEMFVLLGWAWDIDTATRLAVRHRPQRVDIRPLAWARTVIQIDPDHAATVDLSRPLLTVPLPNADTRLVIDGWHRIHRAWTTGIHELPAIHLDAGDERACRIRGGDPRTR
ncbi:hypothetical protein [Actinomadura chibensis]|uniref:ParB/Sulfiredoxin domain-containing protein n=1 Tax=Actinomadura chibensis TaxID=392828 RepID=A0A5D0N8P5_9ACTN|nr:hypothetical protein [Actinomadura chibensis]TYB40800.1 hypothetical protein FXF69_37915 [Actinomadura chibensis]